MSGDSAVHAGGHPAGGGGQVDDAGLDRLDWGAGRLDQVDEVFELARRPVEAVGVPGDDAAPAGSLLEQGAQLLVVGARLVPA
ncbi:hypothetical protein V2I01_05030 [Micromonospora sp. BRA006-A]|nr:hypothetical protein [Micromonospora sp. BRA006-A]